MGQAGQDIELMLLVKTGDAKAFETLVERHKLRVYRLAYRFLGNAVEAQDVAQEVFVKVYLARQNYEPSAKFTTWLYTIVKNTCYKSLARNKPTVSLDAEVETLEGSVPRQIPDQKILDPGQQMCQQEQAELVRRAVDSLPEQQRLAVVLARFEGLSYEEIAKVLGCTSAAVKSMLHRARLILKERLEVVKEGEKT